MTAKLPPGPRDRIFGISIIRELTRDILGYYTGMQREYGDVVYMRLGPYHDFTFFHPDQIKEVLVTKAKHFVRMERLINVLRQWNGNSLLIAEGDEWIRLRRLAQPAFHPRRLASYVTVMADAASHVFDQWCRKVTSEVIDFQQAMNQLTMAIISRAMFGADLGDETKELGRAVKILSEIALREMTSIVPLPDWLPLEHKRQKRWAMRKLDDVIWRFIRERRASGRDEGDLLSMFLLAVDEEGDRTGLTDEQVRDQCMTIFIAGHDTTAAGMTWIGWALASQPDLTSRARAEVIRTIADRVPTFADIEQLGYVEQFVKETLRLYPPAVGVFARRAIDEVTIGDVTIPKNGIARVMFYVTHRDSRWFPEPARFDPDRFGPDRVDSIPKYAYLPFGAGPRVCIGAQFAMTEMTLLTAMLLQRFEIEPAETNSPPQLEAQMSLRPLGGLRLKLSRNKNGVENHAV